MIKTPSNIIHSASHYADFDEVRAQNVGFIVLNYDDMVEAVLDDKPNVDEDITVEPIPEYEEIGPPLPRTRVEGVHTIKRLKLDQVNQYVHLRIHKIYPRPQNSPSCSSL